MKLTEISLFVLSAIITLAQSSTHTSDTTVQRFCTSWPLGHTICTSPLKYVFCYSYDEGGEIDLVPVGGYCSQQGSPPGTDDIVVAGSPPSYLSDGPYQLLLSDGTRIYSSNVPPYASDVANSTSTASISPGFATNATSHTSDAVASSSSTSSRISSSAVSFPTAATSVSNVTSQAQYTTTSSTSVAPSAALASVSAKFAEIESLIMIQKASSSLGASLQAAEGAMSASKAATNNIASSSALTVASSSSSITSAVSPSSSVTTVASPSFQGSSSTVTSGKPPA